MSTPSTLHWNVVGHVLKYLKCTFSFGLFYPTNQSYFLKAYNGTYWASYTDTMGYSDADWANCIDTMGF